MYLVKTKFLSLMNPVTHSRINGKLFRENYINYKAQGFLPLMKKVMHNLNEHIWSTNFALGKFP